MNIHRYLAAAATAATLLLSFSSCKEDGPEIPESNPAPRLLSTDPVYNAEQLEGSTLTVTFTFDQNVKCPYASVSASGITISGNATVAGVNAIDANVKVMLTGLENGESYTLTIPRGTVQGYKDNQDATDEINFKFSMRYVEQAPDPDKIPTRGTSVAWQMQERLGLGFNFGNNLDAFRNGDWAGDLRDVPDETCWGCDKITQEAMSSLKAKGFSSVRIPVTWLKKIGPAPDYKIDETWMARVEEIVGYAEKAGLVCIINMHHDENHHGDADTDWHWQDILGALNSADQNARIKDELAKTWTQIANRFKDKGDWLIFEPYNEINDGGWGYSNVFRNNPQRQYNILNEWAQVFVDAVRATGGSNATRWLAIPGYCANPQFTMDGLELPKDSAHRLMVDVHCYDPYNYCATGTGNDKSEWGHTADASKRCSSDDERAMRNTMVRLYSTYVKNDIPCFFGEFGTINRDNKRELAFERYWFEYFTKCARSFGLAAILWDNQDTKALGMGFIHHGTGEFISAGKEMVGAMSKGMNTADPAYTLQTVYDNAPTF